MENNKKSFGSKKDEEKEKPQDELYVDGREDKLNEMEILKQAFEKEKSRAADAWDKYVRLLAEFDNFKKRHEKEKERLSDFILTAFFREFIPVLEGFEKAVLSNAESAEYHKGMQMIYKNLTGLLEKYGLKKQEALNIKFNPELHEAAGLIEDDEKDEGQITQVVREGYVLNDRILRPAQVMISKKKEEKGIAKIEKEEKSNNQKSG